MEPFIENCEGPVIESLPALPHWPAAGAVTAKGLRKRPEGAVYKDWPV